jgi:CheY-like chemotaxis protein
MTTTHQVLSKLKALYVEDEVLIALDGQDLLSRLGFADVRTAHTLSDGLKVVKEGGFDFVLLDINLGNGETSEPLAEHLAQSGLPFAFTTGYNISSSLMQRFNAPIVPKPFDEKSLRNALAKVL